jgi:hypothetical protein
LTYRDGSASVNAEGEGNVKPSLGHVKGFPDLVPLEFLVLDTLVVVTQTLDGPLAFFGSEETGNGWRVIKEEPNQRGGHNLRVSETFGSGP